MENQKYTCNCFTNLSLYALFKTTFTQLTSYKKKHKTFKRTKDAFTADLYRVNTLNTAAMFSWAITTYRVLLSDKTKIYRTSGVIISNQQSNHAVKKFIMADHEIFALLDDWEVITTCMVANLIVLYSPSNY